MRTAKIHSWDIGPAGKQTEDRAREKARSSVRYVFFRGFAGYGKAFAGR